MDGNLSFNSNNFQTYDGNVGILTNVIDHTDLPEKVMNLLQVANANKSAIPEINQPSKTISIAGVIKGSSAVDLDQRIDQFKAFLNGKDKNLDINYAGSTRRYTATVNASSIKRTGAKKYAPFTVEFICTDPYGRDITATQIFAQNGMPNATFTSTPTVGGSAPFQLPIITVTVVAKTGTGDYIQIANDTNNQKLLVYGAGLKVGDVLVINCETRIVTLNSVPIDYQGTFLELETGLQSITYSDGFTTRSVNILVEYFKRYQ